MPRVERSTVIVTAVAVVVGLAYWGLVSYARDYYEQQSPSSSVFNKRPSGLSVWYRYLEALELAPRALQKWSELPERATIISVAPFANAPTAAEAQRVERWVERGGRLVLVGVEAGQLLRVAVGASPLSGKGGGAVAPSLPGAYADGVRAIDPGPERLLPSEAGWVAHFGDARGKVLLSRRMGKGELVWLAGSDTVSNLGIGERDNARLATLLAAASPGRAIWFDEYHQGYVDESGVWERMSAGGQWAVVLALLAVCAAVLSRGRRIAPAVPAPEEPEARTGAYIGSLAELYRKAGARAEVLSMLGDGLKRGLARRHGTLAAGLARHPGARGALDEADRLREGADMGEDVFMKAARSLIRARREVEGA